MGSELNDEAPGFRPLDVKCIEALEVVRYDTATGLVPVVVQDADTGHVLMLAYANREALKRTYGTGQAWFWSRSRQDYWHKGATSGHVQNVVEVRIDCDGDTVLYLVRPVGPACHTGEVSCFYRGMTRNGDGSEAETTRAEAAADGLETAGQDVSLRPDDGEDERQLSGESHASAARETNPAAMNASACDASVLSELWDVVVARWHQRPNGSYTTYLFEQGVDKSAKKVGEEAVEIVLAAKNAVSNVDGSPGGSPTGRVELATESADLLYHLLVLWKACGVTPDEVFAVLAQRAK